MARHNVEQDNLINAQWRKFIKEWKDILDKPTKDSIKKLTELKERANLDSLLTFRKKDGIAGRCDHNIAILKGEIKEDTYKPSDYDQKRMNK